MVIQVGDTLPAATFSYVPYTDELQDSAACGVPTKLSTDAWKGKRVVLVSVPGAFTPGCHVKHVPPFVQKATEIKSKGVDVLAFIAANDAFVMSAWGRAVGAQDNIIFLSDSDAKFAQELGLSLDLTKIGWGFRTGRWALIIDNLKVTYVGHDTEGINDSSADAVLARL